MKDERDLFRLPMDDKGARVIELIPSDTAVVSFHPRKAGDPMPCEHGKFVVDKDNRTVTCGRCERQLDAMHVLVLIATSESRRRWIVECAELHARKQSEKTIKAAVIALRERGVTPDKFRALYDKYAAEDTHD